MPEMSSTSGSIRQTLTSIFADAFEKLGADRKFGAVVPAQKREFGQFQCNGAMGAAKKIGAKPRDVAQQVMDALADRDEFAKLDIAGPGFINITLSDAWLATFTQNVSDDSRLGVPEAETKYNVIVDYGGPNVAKPMHVGHLRSSIIGDSIVRLMKFMGHDVKGDIHLGDWGTQMGMLIYELSNEKPDLPYFYDSKTDGYPEESPVSIEDLQEMYPRISARCKDNDGDKFASQQATVELQQGRPGYRALWQHFVDVSIAEMKADFHQLGIDFDYWYGESFYHDRITSMVERMKEKGVAVEDDGAWVIHVAKDEDKAPMPPVLLIKSDGGTNYHTTDLATIEHRTSELDATMLLYVVDKRQSLHFEQLFRAVRLAGLATDEMPTEHLAFGTMNGKDGRPFKTRAGGVMRLKDLMAMMKEEALKRMLEAGVAQDYPEEERIDIADKVGMAALKYADLMNVRTADYVFDVERFTRFEGRTGAYLLYSAVRIKSIVRKASDKGFEPGTVIAPTVDAERDLMTTVGSLTDAIDIAVRERMPHHLCAFAYELGQAFSRFYNDCHILKEEDEARRASWLGLSQLVLRELELVLGILGISIPERM